ncbi:putative serine/threonine-protein kinase fhkD [Babesia sp. Xinjiang]|uniref:putative serine/threonine-protein kinase fhkD n=1 Tax=Babesia sp. Xinjiang TaxID=462227 RepID=UPI000A2585B5|nr:putative serine/threonine-protein kinase fhkD [Babesia sp. Xinjiang]ORM39508.1 putative serine/threonine-protein kinase fhkD [Babesia sp. Xinjiang]
MDRSSVPSAAVQGLRPRRAGSKDYATALPETNETGQAERDMSSLAVMCNTLDGSTAQQTAAMGMSRLPSTGGRRSSLFEIGQIADIPVADEYVGRSKDFSATNEIVRSGSWPDMGSEDLENMFDCTLNFRNIGTTLEPKEQRYNSIQLSSRCVDASIRTCSRQTVGSSPRQHAIVSVRVHSSRSKKGSQWMHLIRELRFKRWTQILTETLRQEAYDAAFNKVTEKPNDNVARHACTIVGIVCDTPNTKRLDKRFDASVRPQNIAKQYARFRPRSVAHDKAQRSQPYLRTGSNEFAPSAIVRRGHRDDVDAINYVLIRMRETGGTVQVYDCVEKDTGRALSLKLIARDHAATEIYEQLCDNEHANFVRVVQILEDNQLFYILMDFKDAVYLSEFYQDCHPNTFKAPLIASIVKQLLAALAYIHRKGMVLAGLNMDCIAIQKMRDGKVLAKISNIDNICTSGCEAPEDLRTSIFQAPEIGEGIITTAADMWSIGVMLYMLVEGKPPFKSFNTNYYVELKAIIQATRLSFASQRWNDSPGMKDFCIRCLNGDYEKRISSAMEAFIHQWISE